MLQANARSINVKRTDLLTKLRENRDKHAAEFKVAMEGFRMEVLNVLEDAVAKLEKDDKSFDKGLFMNEDPPQDHTADYDLVIGMMEMSVDEIIQMDSNSFNQYVMDNWAWKQQFAETTSKYITVAAAAKR
jgi:hypothetical protein